MSGGPRRRSRKAPKRLENDPTAPRILVGTKDAGQRQPTIAARNG